MEYRRFGAKIVVRLDKGEEIIECVKRICQENNILLASISGIGAVNKINIGFFIQSTKEYRTKEISGSMEITSLSGTISQLTDRVYTHLHATLTGEDYKAFGGHLNEAWVGATCELVLVIIDGRVDREFSPEIGLNLIKFIAE
jgi:uncharacterized protein